MLGAPKKKGSFLLPLKCLYAITQNVFNDSTFQAQILDAAAIVLWLGTRRRLWRVKTIAYNTYLKQALR